MFADMFKSFFSKSSDKRAAKRAPEPDPPAVSRRDVEDMLARLVVDDDRRSVDGRSVCSGGDNAVDAMELLSIADNGSDYPVVRFDDDAKSEVSSVGENRSEPGSVGQPKDEDPGKQKLVNKINSLQCMFTWNLKPNKKRNLVSNVRNKYGDYNLDITSPEFTFERYIGNLIIGYEMFHNGDTELGQMKMLEIGKWLEELDGLNNNTNELYLSIKIGLKHVMSSTFVHMLFASNLFEECNWFLESIDSFANMDPRSRAAVHTVRAAVLIEYGGNSLYLKKACECAKKACDLDPNTGHWFYVYSLALTAQRQFLSSIRSIPAENEIKTIQQAIGLSDGNNTSYNYHRMTLDKDTTTWNFHNSTNKNDKHMIENNLKENRTLVQMIKTIVNMKPRDPLLVVKCAQTLMSLPYKVRDLKLAKKYLEIALEMAPNDSVVLNAVSRAAEIYNKNSTSKQAAAETKNQDCSPSKKSSKLGEDLALLVRKHRAGIDVLPNLTDLLTQDKYNEFEKQKILAQICSYTILFKNELKVGVQHFMTLIKQPSMINSNLIKEHFSTFGSKKFHLGELICNEIRRLATNSSGTSSENMLFYYKMLTTIMESCNIELKDVDSSMKAKLIVHASTRSTSSKTTDKNDVNPSDSESDDQSERATPNTKKKNRRLRSTGPKGFTVNTQHGKPQQGKPQPNKGANTKNNQPKNVNKNQSAPPNVNSHSRNNDAVSRRADELKHKLSKFLVPSGSVGHPGTSNPLTTENLRNLQTQTEIEKYTQQLYQNILQQNVSQQQFNYARYPNHANVNSQSPQPLFQYPQPLPLLSLRPQINPQKLQPNTKKSKNAPPKKK